MYHAWLFDFLDGLGGGNDPLNFQNRAIAGFWENARFIRSNGRKTTFEWPTVVSEVIFPRFWGVVCVEKCFRNFEILIRSAVSEMSRFARFCAFSQNPAMARFWKFRGSFPPPRPSKKSKSQAWYIFLHKNHLLIPCVQSFICAQDRFITQCNIIHSKLVFHE